MPNKPIWTEGLLISQHHFQQQDRYHEALLRDRLSSVVHYSWGITDLEIDEQALASGNFRLKRFAAIWPDGESVRCGEGTEEPGPAPRPFEGHFTADAAKLEIFIALAHESDAAGNVATGDDGEVGRRYTRVGRTVSDVNAGGSPQEVETARPNVRIFFGTERHDGFSTIRLAELVRRPNGQPMVRDNYVPPVLHLAAAPFLHNGLHRVLAAITARQRQLAQERKQRQAGSVDFHATDTRKFWLLHTLNGAIPLLTHLLDTPRVHPEEAYLLLATLVGQLSSFAPDADPGNLPKFNYLELGDAFEVMFARVLSLLSGSIEQHYTEIPLEHRADGMFIGKVGDPALLGQEFFVAVKATLADALVRERFPAVMKMAGWNHIYDVVKQARFGVRVEIEWSPPGALPLKPGILFFRVRREGPFWDEIVKTATIALYIPNEPDWREAVVSIYVVDPKHMR
jgi:type VI secretion system protein ImpJ